eukprot:gene28552-37511_t
MYELAAIPLNSWQNKFPVVYVYTVVPAVCKYGLPSYIKDSLEQASFTQPDCAVVMISNYAECREIEKALVNIENIVKIDAASIISNRTRHFSNLSREIFVADGLNELWITSALRFFIMEDFMVTYNFTEILHVEADNMLYGNITAILPNGDGIKPFAVNEMSMLAFYHKYNPTELRLLPVVPFFQSYAKNRYICDLPSYSPGGAQVGPPTGLGIWDANSWGQYIGGTSKKRGKDKGFMDSSHITGQAIGSSHCRISFICGNQSREESSRTITPIQAWEEYTRQRNSNQTSESTSSNSRTSDRRCYTAPFVRCSEEYPWTPLWNLHVHSKHNVNYKSAPCPCA